MGGFRDLWGPNTLSLAPLCRRRCSLATLSVTGRTVTGVILRSDLRSGGLLSLMTKLSIDETALHEAALQVAGSVGDGVGLTSRSISAISARSREGVHTPAQVFPHGVSCIYNNKGGVGGTQ